MSEYKNQCSENIILQIVWKIKKYFCRIKTVGHNIVMKISLIIIAF